MIDLRTQLIKSLDTLLIGASNKTAILVVKFLIEGLTDRGAIYIRKDEEPTEALYTLLNNPRLSTTVIFNVFVDLVFILPVSDMKYFWHSLTKSMQGYIEFLESIPPVQQNVHDAEIENQAYQRGLEAALSQDEDSENELEESSE